MNKIEALSLGEVVAVWLAGTMVMVVLVVILLIVLLICNFLVLGILVWVLVQGGHGRGRDFSERKSGDEAFKKR